MELCGLVIESEFTPLTGEQLSITFHVESNVVGLWIMERQKLHNSIGTLWMVWRTKDGVESSDCGPDRGMRA